LEGEIAPVDCVRDASACDRADDCVVRELWCEVTGAMRGVLEARTLEDLKRRWEYRRPGASRQE
jgi:DNA-binding IscR family transcriptional regulator